MSRPKQPTVDVVDAEGVVLSRAGSRTRPSKSTKATPRGSWGAARTIHLQTLDDVRVEMARVYRAMAGGQLAISDGTRLTYSLSLLGKAIEASAIEERIAALESLDPNPLPMLGGQLEEEHAQ